MVYRKPFAFYPLVVGGTACLILMSLFWGAMPIMAEQENQTNALTQSEIEMTTSPSSAFIGGRNLAPGDQIQSTIAVHNYGQLGFEYGMSARKQSGSDLLYEIFEVMIEHNDRLLYVGALQDVQYIEVGTLRSGSQDQLTFTVDFPLHAGNEYQGLETVVAFDFTAHGITEPRESDPDPDPIPNPDPHKDPTDNDRRDTFQPIISHADDPAPPSGEHLPSTATPWYTFLLLGLVLVLIGFSLLWRYRDRLA